jgi:hypothetical protein
MTAPRSIGFVPPRTAWLFGHASRPSGRRAQAAALLLSAALLVAAAAGWWTRGRAVTPPATSPVTAQRPAAPMALTSTPALSAADRARINRVVRRLNTPWGRIFEALENQAGARAALLSLETDADRGAVRVTTEGPSLDELLMHAERVQATAPFVRTRLLRIEPPDTPGTPGTAGTAAGLTRLSFDLVIQ